MIRTPFFFAFFFTFP
ncbi:MAG: hypothetical protein G5701_07075 [Serratia symbiotica]|nr:pheA operon leader peptide PheL [Enterobacter sp. RIT 418]NIG98682.1 hypothetical protein [Serratia symbiotica]